MATKKLVTAALPYANGPIHVGHMVEYIQADVYVRFLRLIKEDVIYICADDTHGTPIEVNAAKQGIAPEQLVAKYHVEHAKDFAEFLVSFDNFYSTNSPENKEYSDLFFNTLKEKGHIYKKEIELSFCPVCKRFLPDRYVRGTCPKCNSEDQYGDVCEKCNAAHKTTDLIKPYCVTCRTAPIRRSSEHYFFKLSAFSAKLKKWITKHKGMQQEIKNFVLNWIESGLEDWCISRDGPYFGFKIPGEQDKYYYVWLDAPIGYLSSAANYCNSHGLNVDTYVKGKGGEMIHFIGKDIIYFHFLFWPAMLMAAGFNLPSAIHVHGFLTVSKEKMSKSRGTFYTARDYLNSQNPEFLRFYYAANLGSKMADISLDWDDFKARVNNELVSNIANFAYRVLSFTNSQFESRVSTLPKDPFIRKVELKVKGIKNLYETLEFREAVREILAVSSLGNTYFQGHEPWKSIKEDRKKTHQQVSLCVNLVKDLAILLKPVMPRFAGELECQLNLKELTWDDLGFTLENHTIGTGKIIFSKIEKAGIDTTQDDFSKADLRVAQIVSVADHPKADKLYVIRVSLGQEERQLVAGLRPYFTKEDLIRKRIVIVANLEPAELRGIESQGMLLAADDGKEVKLLDPGAACAGEQVHVDGIATAPAARLAFSDFAKIGFAVKGGKVLYSGKALGTGSGPVTVDITDGARVR